MSGGIHFDVNGKDITEYMTLVAATQYDATGKVIGSVVQAWPYTKMRIDAGERFIAGDAQFDYRTGQSPFYVNTAGDEPVLQPRVEIGRSFDMHGVPPGIEATIKDVPACTVRFSGPLNGSQDHPGGDLAIGFRMPGTYEIAFEAFPYLPASFTLTVESAAS